MDSLYDPQLCPLCGESLGEYDEKVELYPDDQPDVWGHANCAELARRQEAMAA